MNTQDPRQAQDKVPDPVSSERAQKGERNEGPTLERPERATEAVDKVITPTEVKELENDTRQINERLRTVENKLHR
ncbi:hypothetical protein IAE35_14970 [Pseudomonas sp. S75]|uniref:hypothetical protein n=1 Tax=unclassified Pseudomonas TaxID=196821 RepID=UPI001908719F|nr:MULTISPECIES: hypothetical protein [unclassified Pseudomonas]MBJ9975906.1 hypothetical protein [Pseudomonas sp. S30]MBK0154646.1 hypothetical protein [Pseudomonas sp. S75]